MAIDLTTPAPDELRAVLTALREWQVEGAPVQLHPGDLGWAWQVGPERLAGLVRTWSRHGRTLAVGFLDGPVVVRLAIAPEAGDDEELARQIAADVSDPDRGVLPAGPRAVEARLGPALARHLSATGWTAGDPWQPLRRVLDEPVAPPDLEVVTVGPDRARDCAAVHRSAFGSERFTDDRWRAMAAGPAFTEARCLLGLDENGAPVATVTVWSAGPGRPGLVEPMGIHADHRGRGHGTAICVAAAAALQEMGASSATVATEATRVGAVRTYVAAGYQPLGGVRDLALDAS